MRFSTRIGVLVAVTLALTGGCDWFKTRDAVAPGEEQSSWQVPTVPARVFQNMKTGLEELDGVNYVRSLEASFTFEPLPTDLNNPTLIGKFDNWTFDVENQVVDRMLAENRAIQVQFNGIRQIRDELPFADFEADYVLTTVSRAQPPDTTVYQGRAQFFMKEGTKNWQLIKWADIAGVEGFSTWGFLRGTLRQ